MVINFLKKSLVASVLLMASFSTLAYSCFEGGVGHCVWGFDQNEPEKSHLIDSGLFQEFCSRHHLHCSALDNTYHSIIGRYLDEEIFIIAGKGFGGPDLIFNDKRQAEEFVNDFRTVSTFSDTLFYVQNINWRVRSVMAIGYREKTAFGSEEIKLLFLPNEWGHTSEDYTYVPPDM